MVVIENIIIQKAEKKDETLLTKIAFKAKKHWNYPKYYYQIWKDELTITKDYIFQNIVFKAQFENEIIGFYSIVENKDDFWSGEVFVQKGYWLEHIFVLPEYHHKGIGKLLIDHAEQVAKERRIERLLIFVDPYARGFYDKVGATFLTDSKSSIPGRLIPIYELKL